MKRQALRVLVLVALGAIVNIAVAWGCALWSPRGSAAADVSVDDREFWIAQPEVVRFCRPTIQDLVLEGRMESGAGVEHRMIFALAVDRHCGETLLFGRRVQVRAGWPILFLSGDAQIVGDRWMTHELFSATALGRYERTTDPPWRALPLRPVWPGFAINTAFYAALLWLALLAPFALRRWRRIRRGLCAKCAYDLRATSADRCPECGWAREFTG